MRPRFGCSAGVGAAPAGGDGGSGRRLMGRAGGTGGIGDRDLDLVAPDAVDRLHGRAGLANQRGGILGSEEEREGHPARVGHREVPDHPRREQVIVQPWIPDPRQRLDHARLERGGH